MSARRTQPSQPSGRPLTGERRTWAVAAALAVLAALPIGPVAARPTPPQQPESGPGGYAYLHGGVTTLGPYFTALHPNQENHKYYIFEPADPRPDIAPVILFIHGYQAYQPAAYAGWMGHLVRKGYTVVWVNYDVGITAPWGYINFVEATWKDALRRLDTYWWENHVLPAKDANWEMITAIVGHSAGAYLGPIVAAHATEPDSGIPVPRALVCIEPGGLGLIPKADFSQIDPDTKLLVLVGDEDDIVCKSTAQFLWENTPQIPDANRDFLFFVSDDRGEPAQIANHFFPNSTGYNDTAAVDGRDFYITYKLSTGLIQCAFFGLNCNYALGQGGPLQVGMGEWSDGQPVQPLQWIADPSDLETTCVDKFREYPPWGAPEAQAAERFGPDTAGISNRVSTLLPLAVFLVFLRRRRREGGR